MRKIYGQWTFDTTDGSSYLPDVKPHYGYTKRMISNSHVGIKQLKRGREGGGDGGETHEE